MARPSSKRSQNSPLTFAGIHVVKAALAAPSVEVSKVYVASSRDLGGGAHEIVELAGEQGLRIQETSPRELDRLFRDFQHQGVACQVRSLPNKELDEVSGNVLALDQVQDPRNLGAILRSANAFGFEALVIPKDNSADLTPAAAKASSGAIFHTPVLSVTNLSRALRELKDQNYWIVSLDAEADQSLSQIDVPKPFVLVVGAEGKGIRANVAKQADFHAHIPIQGSVESLNASVAAAVAMHALTNATHDS